MMINVVSSMNLILFFHFSFTNMLRFLAEKNKGDYPFEADWIHYLERLIIDLDRKYVTLVFATL